MACIRVNICDMRHDALPRRQIPYISSSTQAMYSLHTYMYTLQVRGYNTPKSQVTPSLSSIHKDRHTTLRDSRFMSSSMKFLNISLMFRLRSMPFAFSHVSDPSKRLRHLKQPQFFEASVFPSRSFDHKSDKVIDHFPITFHL